MAKLFVIAGHGAGDPGAVGNGYTEAERVRALATKIKAYGGDNVMLGDTNRNWYADNGISFLNISKEYQIIELHMDSASASARGGHVIIKSGFTADAYDNALASMLKSILPGRSNMIVGRSDLANPNRAAAKGYGYRLVEFGFISNATDVQIFNSRMDDIAKGVLSAFGIAASGSGNTGSTAPSKPSSSYSIDDIARQVIRGDWGNGQDRINRLTAAGYDANAVQSRVNQLLGQGGSTASSTPSYSIDDIARQVIRGDWGNGSDRINRLSAAGYDANAVQNRVNQLLGQGGSTSPSYSIDDIARQVIRGDWGNGQDRINRLTAAGYDANAVQNRVNQLL